MVRNSKNYYRKSNLKQTITMQPNKMNITIGISERLIQKPTFKINTFKFGKQNAIQSVPHTNPIKSISSIDCARVIGKRTQRIEVKTTEDDRLARKLNSIHCSSRLFRWVCFFIRAGELILDTTIRTSRFWNMLISKSILSKQITSIIFKKPTRH